MYGTCVYGTRVSSQTLIGHTRSINDIAVAGVDRPHLVLTASDDESVRLWNLRCDAPAVAVYIRAACGVCVSHVCMCACRDGWGVPDGRRP